jgi:hypothetical protein
MATEPKGNSEGGLRDDPEFADQENAELDAAEEGDEEPPADRRRPMCPGCGWSNTRLSHTRTLMDTLLQVFSLRAFRCRSCGRRFRARSRKS